LGQVILSGKIKKKQGITADLSCITKHGLKIHLRLWQDLISKVKMAWKLKNGQVMVESVRLDDVGRNFEKKLHYWFTLPLGEYLLDQEQVRISKILPKLFGYHILQVGSLGREDLLASSSISHKVKMLLGSQEYNDYKCNIYGDGESLAIASDSLDVVVLPHVLEFVSNPHKLLREVERILIGEGYLVLTGLNPWSLWGLWRLMLFWREEPPWNGHFYGYTRIKDWLSLLDFELIQNERFFFRPPIQKKSLMQKLVFWEKLGKHCWPFFGGAYVIVAKKRVISLTPIKMRWRARRQLIASGIVEPGA
jgi:SAM-dependent methyltransferase